MYMPLISSFDLAFLIADNTSSSPIDLSSSPNILAHVFFLLYEMITRRKPSDKFLEYAQMVGMGILFLLLIWANFNDILRFFFR